MEFPLHEKAKLVKKHAGKNRFFVDFGAAGRWKAMDTGPQAEYEWSRPRHDSRSAGRPRCPLSVYVPTSPFREW